MPKLWERALAMTNDDCLGIHIAEATPVSAYDVHAYAMLSSPTLRDAFTRASRYQRLINEGTELTFTERQHDALLRHGLPGGGAVARQPAEFLATTWLRLGRLVTGSAWSPAQIFFAHDRPPDTREHARVFDAPIQFSSGQTAMRLPATVLELSNPRADATLAALLDRHTSSLLEQHPSLATASGRVRAWLLRARARRFSERHEWMVRSYSLSLFVVSFSLWVPALSYTPLPPSVSYPLGLILATTVNLIAAEIWIRRHRERRGARARRETLAVA